MPGAGQVPFALLSPVVSFLSSGRITILAAMWPPLCVGSAVAEYLSGETVQPPLPPLLSPVVSFLSNGRITIVVGTPTPLVIRDVERCGRDRRPRLVKARLGGPECQGMYL
ncbi:hypothetical protein BX281_7096 [Streptomyces sp. Ag82_O1-15]|jgi:hypothetical protein|nr:hypothetical protein BX281_7096 [Streptomyces sp. Ag82_O1-15]